MTRTFRVLSAVLSYPTAEIQAAAAEFMAVLEGENLLPAADRQALAPLLRQLAEQDIYELQERYVLLFDRTRSLSLHLFEHIHGESRDRGQAMVDLAELYTANGLIINTRELPDFLPLFLEFLSILPPAEALEHLEQPLHIIAALAARLRRRDSVYAAALGALEAMTRTRPAADVLQALLDVEEDDPNDFAALDAIWEEEAVAFGPGASEDEDCPRVAEMISHMHADPAAARPAAKTDKGA